MSERGNLVTTEWLAQHVDDPSVAVADCRFDLSRPEAGREAYTRAHIPGAFYLDLDADLSGPRQAHGGRHPLPDPEAFARKLGSRGVDGTVTVVAYDDQQGGLAAARLWWILRYLGHERAKVLDGGWAAWCRAGYPTTSEVRPRTPRTFIPRVRAGLAVGLEEVRRRLGRADVRLVDSRAPERYRGEVEPLDPAAGHIPGAVNLPWTGNQDAQGMLRPASVLRERFSELREGAREVIVYCGSGVSACANLLAMEEAGITNAVLYPGSWSDWCSYPENPVATAKGR
jgi:thiosulfate/3-mercaptopyruvate sulfurtransferase